ncbi:hypothetical protein [Maribacter aestuarii]|uniref:hypothetical protein n=1 Tax=Maribacter aestuarii TaxID=1130723 RepID=UPI00248BA0ED|nr:hypothetical protein [Maribacter aestuarii]
MIFKSKLLLIVTLLFSIHKSIAQDVFTEVGIGLGNVIGKEHQKGKAEIYFNIFKSYRFGEIGLDISTGGNFIPGNISGIEDNTETLSPNDAKFTSISAFYRLPIIKKIYFEPRFGYSTLFYFINADNERKINKSNITYGLGIGTTLFENLSLSLRYQHLGNTPNYEGSKESTTIISKSEPLNLVFLRVAYRFNWDSIF